MNNDPQPSRGRHRDRETNLDESIGLLEQLAVASLLSEAEDLTGGVRHLSIATGDPESDDDLARINALTTAARTDRTDAATKAIRGGNDYLTIRIEGAGAETFVEDLATLAHRSTLATGASAARPTTLDQGRRHVPSRRIFQQAELDRQAHPHPHVNSSSHQDRPKRGDLPSPGSG